MVRGLEIYETRHWSIEKVCERWTRCWLENFGSGKVRKSDEARVLFQFRDAKRGGEIDRYKYIDTKQ